MSQKLRVCNDFVIRILRSRRFFYVIVAILVIQAAWIALTARYPQAFDENFHFSLIQFHAQQWLPFFDHQPAGASINGAVVRDPSYLFHFVLSLPYRVLTHLTVSEQLQVIVLRFINIAIFVAGLFVYRRLFDDLRISTAMRNIVLTVFVLLPVVPLLAGQINYDNMMFALTGLLFIYIARYIQYMRGRQPTQPLIQLRLVLLVLLVGGLGSIVKFAFAPIFLAAIAALIITTIFYYNLSRIKPKSFKTLFEITGRPAIIVLAVCAAVVLALCIERYGINLVQYHSPVPKCDKVLSIQECQLYSPWARDYQFAQTYPRPTLQGYAVYPFVWVWRMIYETMFTITSYLYVPWNTVTYMAYSPLRIAFVASLAAVLGGVIGVMVFWRRIRRNRPLVVLLAITTFYTFVLFVQNLSMFRHTGEAVAIHGRYLIPVYPVLLLALAVGWRGILERFHQGRYAAVVLVVLLLLFMQGGGITTWLVKSDPSWYWQNSPAAAGANAAVKMVVDRVVYH